MHTQRLILYAIRTLQARRPDASVLVGDIEDVMRQHGRNFQRATVQLHLKRLVDQHMLERLDQNVYRLTPAHRT
ncbi:hypothetical protein [Deinococcus sp. QL22]|uniref:hypothetical protein n=1 Tax=Deinococcus sp. QL22 TaxID=2939437 RepID=UPI002016E509|nr:hypothetical protein [Deinococcus sp. QL22]UQN05486.1 hypothetical protein M1R55_11430 [Deinococcus sp. QL22]